MMYSFGQLIICVILAITFGEQIFSDDVELDDRWVWIGSYDDYWLSNACAHDGLCIKLIGKSGYDSRLYRPFENIYYYYNLYITYGISKFLDNNASCFVEYKYDTEPYQTLIQYTNENSPNTTYTNQVQYIPNSTLSVSTLYIQFRINGSDTNSCFMNGFELYGTAYNPPPAVRTCESNMDEIIYSNDMRSEASIDSNWIFIGDYDKHFGNSYVCPSGQICVKLSGISSFAGTTLTRLFDNIDSYYNIYISYGITVANMPQNKFCNVKYKYGSDEYKIIAQYTTPQSDTLVKLPHRITCLPNVTSSTLTIQFEIKSTSDIGSCFMNNFILYGITAPTASPVPLSTVNSAEIHFVCILFVIILSLW